MEQQARYLSHRSGWRWVGQPGFDFQHNMDTRISLSGNKMDRALVLILILLLVPEIGVRKPSMAVCSVLMTISELYSKVSSYRAVNTPRLGCENQYVNAIYGNSFCLFEASYKTHRCILWAGRRIC